MRDDAERTRALQAFGSTDLWAPVSLDGLPRELVDAVERKDWAEAKRQLGPIMDGLSSDGVYGRALLQLVRRLPLGVDPVFDRYRAAAAIDHGDWDDLRACLESSPVAAPELGMLRDALIRSVNDVHGRPTMSPDEAPYVAYEFQLAGRLGWYKQWARRLQGYDASPRLARPDVPAGRHLRFRQLHHAVLHALGQAHGGQLSVAAGLASEAQHMGDEGEPHRDMAEDVEALTLLAMGEPAPKHMLRLFLRTPTPRGVSPLGTLEWLLHLMPFLTLLGPGAFGASAGLLQRLAARIGSPRAQMIAECWAVAADPDQLTRSQRTGLAAMIAKSRDADPGLRVLPTLLGARASGRYSAFAEAERLARGVGNVWAQVSALTWMNAMNPSPAKAVALIRLLQRTDWRRPVLVPVLTLSEAAVGMLTAEKRDPVIIELALASGRAATATEVASRHVDPALSSVLRMRAAEALARIGTSQARRLLSGLAQDHQIGAYARTLLRTAPRIANLTDREIEVIDLGGTGLTNRQIALQLDLSPHTVARHFANAMDKLGAMSRADAAVRLGRLSGEPLSQLRVKGVDSVSESRTGLSDS